MPTRSILLAIVLAIVAFVAAWLYRYDIVYAGPGNYYLRLDRWTGGVEACMWQDSLQDCQLLHKAH